MSTPEPSPGPTDRHREGGSYEEIAGYSRGARRGHHLAVSGTTAGGTSAAGDTYTQARDALSRAIASVEQLGGRRGDVLRSRLLLAPQADWEAASRAHRELLGDVAPANSTYFVHALVGDDLLVEVELDAVILE
ncbi:MAG: putative Endoribonuclease [Acidimicrobiaceae bacterium]|nr:putative Endoribonuclease [Acidimicrobiaceae bacterium]